MCVDQGTAFEKFVTTYDTLTITGPTGVGKTRLALCLAQNWPIEIISMDSALVYRGMDIGTAKPSPIEQGLVKHHLIDIRTPDQSYNAAEFSKDAKLLIEQIKMRGKLPVIVGGTLLYYKALFEGLNDMPSTDLGVRALINQEAATSGWPAMHALLKEIDPVTAARLASGDAQRISRALEVFRSSGRPLSSFFKDKEPVFIKNCLISLEPSNRAWLHERLEQRFHQMLDVGFIQEVKALKQNNNLSVESPSVRCVGYRQVWEALEQDPDLGEETRKNLLSKGLAATRQLAKRQLTWLRSLEDKVVIEPDICNTQEELLKILRIQQ